MKQIAITFLLLLGSLMVFSQKQFNTGVYAEGGYFLPKGESNGFATGGGLFVSSTLKEKLSVTLQAGYRYKSNNTTTIVYNEHSDGSGTGYSPYEDGTSYNTTTKTFKHHYIVLPFKISYLLTKKLFIETGITTCCILNYDKIDAKQLPDGSYELPDTYKSVNNKCEFDWVVGLGYNMSPKLKAALNYTQGFKDQGMGIGEASGNRYGQVYKNRMFMLNLSYSIFGGKQ